ncbi:MAG: DNA recombination protein RmuC [Candidatus Acidiferrales bacterium]
MNPVVWFAAGAVAVAAIAMIVWWSGRRAQEQLSEVRREMQGSLTAQNQLVTSQVNHLMQTMTQQLGQVRQELQSSVASTGQLAADAQRDVAERLKSSTDALVQMTQRIGEVHQASQDLSKATQALQSVLGGAKTRGILGEVTLERLLEDALPRSAYATQYKFVSTGAIVDAIVRSGERLLCVDSKFPLEAYRRLTDGGDEARREFCQAVRSHADSIAKKYILPNEHTFDYALMFVPSEGVYYELLITADTKYGQLDEYCRGKKVFPVSPNTLYACLSAVALSLQGQKIEENARQLIANLAGLKKQFDDFGVAYDKVGTHFRNAQQRFDEATNKLNRANASLDQMTKGALPEPEVPMLSFAKDED